MEYVYNNINFYNIRVIIINIVIYLLSIPAQPPLLYTKIISLSSSFAKVFCKYTVRDKL